MALERFPFTPLQEGYTYKDGNVIESVSLSGGPSRYRQTMLGAVSNVSVSFLLNPAEYSQLRDFYVNVIKYGSLPFVIALWTNNGTTLTDHEAHIVPGSLNLASQSGLTFAVNCSLEVKPTIDQGIIGLNAVRTVKYTSGNIKPNKFEYFELNAFSHANIIRVDLDQPGWFVIYSTYLGRSLDINRSIKRDPDPLTRTQLEMIFVKGKPSFYVITPARIFISGESPKENTMYCRITNTNTSTTRYNLSIDYLERDIYDV